MAVTMCTSLAISRQDSPGKNSSVLVLGLGNILLSDEGVGVHVVQNLQELALPCNVEVMDGGTASLDVLLLAQGIEKLVVIDAVRASKEAGTVYNARLKIDEYYKLEQFFSGGNKVSLHQISLIDALVVSRKMDCAPNEIVIIGVEPEKVDWGLELTDKVKQKVSKIIDMVLREIENAVHRK